MRVRHSYYCKIHPRWAYVHVNDVIKKREQTVQRTTTRQWWKAKKVTIASCCKGTYIAGQVWHPSNIFSQPVKKSFSRGKTSHSQYLELFLRTFKKTATTFLRRRHKRFATATTNWCNKKTGARIIHDLITSPKLSQPVLCSQNAMLTRTEKDPQFQFHFGKKGRRKKGKSGHFRFVVEIAIPDVRALPSPKWKTEKRENRWEKKENGH